MVQSPTESSHSKTPAPCSAAPSISERLTRWTSKGRAPASARYGGQEAQSWPSTDVAESSVMHASPEALFVERTPDSCAQKSVLPAGGACKQGLRRQSRAEYPDRGVRVAHNPDVTCPEEGPCNPRPGRLSEEGETPQEAGAVLRACSSFRGSGEGVSRLPASDSCTADRAMKGGQITVFPPGVPEEAAGCFEGMVALLDPRMSAEEQIQ